MLLLLPKGGHNLTAAKKSAKGGMKLIRNGVAAVRKHKISYKHEEIRAPQETDDKIMAPEKHSHGIGTAPTGIILS